MTTCKECGKDFEAAGEYYAHGCPSSIQTDQSESSFLESPFEPGTVSGTVPIDESTAGFLDRVVLDKE